MTAPIRVLELRSVRGTGGGPEKTILLGAARTDKSLELDMGGRLNFYRGRRVSMKA